jgi:Lysine methyltransferase
MMESSAEEAGDAGSTTDPSSQTSAAAAAQAAATASSSPILTIYNRYPIHLTEDWDSGIGGGLWSTGLAMAHYFCTAHFQSQLERIQCQQNKRGVPAMADSSHNNPPIRVLELGSGNGFLSVCLVVAAMMRRTTDMTESKDDVPPSSNSSSSLTDLDPIPVQVIATDTAEHLLLMKNSIDSNLKRISSACSFEGNDNTVDLSRFATVQKYLWGDTSTADNSVASSDAFDLIIGSDLAYRDELHDPLIAALQHFHATPSASSSVSSVSSESSEFLSSTTTTTLLGVTMTDTKPLFFQKLVQAGFQYEKLADHLLRPEFRGGGSRQFGIFVIYR